MNVLMAMDDTLNEYSEAVAAAYKEETGIDTLSSVRKGYMFENATTWSRNDVQAFLDRHSESIFVNTPMKQYLKPMLAGLYQRQFRFDICTRRNSGYNELSLDWIHDNGLTEYIENFHIGIGPKFDYMKNMIGKLPQVVIEDRWDNAEPFLKAKIPVILFNYEHNEGHEHRLLTRVNNWWDVYQALCWLQITSKDWMK